METRIDKLKRLTIKGYKKLKQKEQEESKKQSKIDNAVRNGLDLVWDLLFKNAEQGYCSCDVDVWKLIDHTDVYEYLDEKDWMKIASRLGKAFIRISKGKINTQIEGYRMFIVWDGLIN